MKFHIPVKFGMNSMPLDVLISLASTIPTWQLEDLLVENNSSTL